METVFQLWILLGKWGGVGWMSAVCEVGSVCAWRSRGNRTACSSRCSCVIWDMELERGLAGAVLPWHVRAAEVTVRGKRLDTQLCCASLELKCLWGMFTASWAGKIASNNPKQTNQCFWLPTWVTPLVQGFDHFCRLEVSKVLYRLKYLIKMRVWIMNKKLTCCWGHLWNTQTAILFFVYTEVLTVLLGREVTQETFLPYRAWEILRWGWNTGSTDMGEF